MTFNYMATKTYLDSIDIEDIGNVCLNAFNDRGEEYYLVISTKLGWTEIKEFGPCIVDFNKTENYFSLLYNKLEYNDSKIAKIIEKFINNEKREITQIFFIDKKDANERLNTLKIGD